MNWNHTSSDLTNDSTTDLETKPKNCCRFGSRTKLFYCLLDTAAILILLVTIFMHTISSDFGRSSILSLFSDCYYRRNGEDYAGYKSVSRTGLVCQDWMKMTPHEHEYTNSKAVFRDGSAEGAKNYCRNPRSFTVGVRDRPWCFTIDPTRRWEYCETKKNICKTRFLFLERSENFFKTKATIFYPIQWAVVAIWTVIYVWLFCALSYTLIIACSRSKVAWVENGRCHTDILPWYIVLVLCLSLISHVTWMYLWDREYEEVAFVMCLLRTFLVTAVAYGTVWYSRKTKRENLEKRGAKQHIANHSLLQNGFVALATIMIFFTLTQFTIVLQLHQVLTEESIALIALSILIFIYLLWCILDLIIMANTLHYIFAPQIVLLLCLVGVLFKSWSQHSIAMNYAVAIIILIFATLLAKVFMTIIQVNRKKRLTKQMEALESSSEYYSGKQLTKDETAKTLNELLFNINQERNVDQRDVLY